MFEDFNDLFIQTESKSNNNDSTNFHKESNTLHAMIKKNTFETNDTSFEDNNFGWIDEDGNFVNNQFLQNEKEQEIELTYIPEDLMIPHIDSSNEQISVSSNERQSLETEENKMLLRDLIILAKEQSSCRYLQQKIDNDPLLARNLFYHKIYKLSIDFYSFYFYSRKKSLQIGFFLI